MSTQAPNQERCGCRRHECVVHTVARSEAHDQARKAQRREGVSELGQIPRQVRSARVNG